ncbi:hypothetical protein IFM89_016551, partial [Coptis chinensis]
MANQSVKAAQEVVQKSEELDISSSSKVKKRRYHIEKRAEREGLKKGDMLSSIPTSSSLHYFTNPLKGSDTFVLDLLATLGFVVPCATLALFVVHFVVPLATILELNTLDRRLQFYEDEIRKLSEQRFMPVWNFLIATGLKRKEFGGLDHGDDQAALLKPEYKPLSLRHFCCFWRDGL